MSTPEPSPNVILRAAPAGHRPSAIRAQQSGCPCDKPATIPTVRGRAPGPFSRSGMIRKGPTHLRAHAAPPEGSCLSHRGQERQATGKSHLWAPNISRPRTGFQTQPGPFKRLHLLHLQLHHHHHLLHYRHQYLLWCCMLYFVKMEPTECVISFSH